MPRSWNAWSTRPCDLQMLHDRISRNGEAVNGVGQQMAGTVEAMSGLRQSVDRLHALELAREQR